MPCRVQQKTTNTYILFTITMFLVRMHKQSIIDSFLVVNSYLKLGWVNLVSNHRTFIFLWQQCYMPSWNCRVNAPKIHHLDCPMPLE
jgi:hypothetical protein